MALTPDLYLSTVSFEKYWGGDRKELSFIIQELKVKSWKEVAGSAVPAYLAHGLWICLRASEIVETPPIAMTPQPLEPGIFPVNNPDENSIILITGNSEITINVVTGVLSQGKTPFWLLSVDTEGNTVDMAMVYKTLNPSKVAEALKSLTHNLLNDLPTTIIPGLTSPLKSEIENLSGCKITVGPVSIFELPLFLRDRWLPPDL